MVKCVDAVFSRFFLLGCRFRAVWGVGLRLIISSSSCSVAVESDWKGVVLLFDCILVLSSCTVTEILDVVVFLVLPVFFIVVGLVITILPPVLVLSFFSVVDRSQPSLCLGLQCRWLGNPCSIH